MENTVHIIDSKNEKASILTLEDVADYLRVHPSRIYWLVKRKQLSAFKLGHNWRFDRESIDRWRADAERSRGRINFHRQ